MNKDKRHKKHASLIKPSWGESFPGLKGLVLAGGESKRMGKDKGSISYHGIAQREYMIQLLNHYVSECYLSCRSDQKPETESPVIEDTFLDLGPFGGVLSAFRHDPNSAWFVVACDIPLLDEETIVRLIEHRDPSKVATCFHDPSTGFPEPLITIWEPRAYPVLLQFLSQGISCLRKSLIHSDAKQIFTDRPEVLRNANTPEESLHLMMLVRGQGLDSLTTKEAG